MLKMTLYFPNIKVLDHIKRNVVLQVRHAPWYQSGNFHSLSPWSITDLEDGRNKYFSRNSP